MGLKFLRPLLYKGLTFATLHLSEKEVNFMERLQILAIDIRSVFEPSLRNLPTRLSTIVALLVLNSFNSFKIDTELTFSNLSWFFLRNLILFPIESGSFLTRSLARFAKYDFKKFVIVLGENVSSFFVGGHMLVVRSFKSAKPNFTKLFWFSYSFK